MSDAPPPSPHRSVLAAVEGYADLGLTDLAWAELDALPAEDRALPDVLETELHLQMRDHAWEDALITGHRLMATEPSRGPAWLHTAYAMHELGRAAEARTVLLQAPESLRSEPLYHYNMACYLAVLGAVQDAEICLRKALSMDAGLRRHARHDPDLKALREALA